MDREDSKTQLMMLSSIQNLKKIQGLQLLRLVAKAQYRTQRRWKIFCCSRQLLKLNRGHRQDTRFVIAFGTQLLRVGAKAQYRTQRRQKIYCCSGQLLHINTAHREELRYVVDQGSCYNSIQYIEKIKGSLLLRIVATAQCSTQKRYKVCFCSGQLIHLNTGHREDTRFVVAQGS